MNANETFNEASQEKWVLTPTQTLEDLNLLSRLERDVVETLNARNESRKRRMCDFEAPSFDLGFSLLKSQKQEMKTNDQLNAKMIVNAHVPIAIEVPKPEVSVTRKSNRIQVGGTRRMGDFEAPSFDLGFSLLKSQKQGMKTNDQLDAKMIVNAPIIIATEVPKPKVGGTRKSNRIPKLSHAHKSPYYKRQ
ncbi:hypothetical protein Tco_0129875, partial [Tanacetum coccineum]